MPINYRLSPPEIAYILSDSDAKAFITHERFADVVVPAADEAGIPADGALRRRLGRRASGRSTSCIAGQPDTLPDDRLAGAAMHYTSGTTGRPKGVKRPLTGLDPDTSAELFSMFLLLFGIGPRDGHVHLVDVAELPHRGHHVRGQRAAGRAHASSTWTSGIPSRRSR